ncbi:putative cyclic-di-GMP phosphodiesterase AdrB [Crateriforma conspicua]|uniref:Putative cyclic-di-GMP phosphodiesterase AdrB n=2 Tax=Crateriforma conspicua TaxID=2527996 RepID=A0A5C5Y2Q2_9PLAN|nr:putative cyclic-di-GMP phosphodiesterase AdrB [Crateriforma conspicua]
MVTRRFVIEPPHVPPGLAQYAFAITVTMSSVHNAAFDRLCQSTACIDDVWFLCGPTSVGDSVRHIAIDDDPFVIGRKAGTALRLQFRTVSGNHASLSVVDGRLMVRDLGSTNGTYLNGKRLESGLETQLKDEDLVHFAEAPFRIRRQSPTGVTAGTISENVCDQALALVQFDRLMSQRLVRPHFQPIVKLQEDVQVGFEVLGRGSVFGLESVGAMFRAAEQLNLEVELSRLLRWEGLRIGRDIPDDPTLYVNTHPKELDNIEALIASLPAVREMAGDMNLVLEIHEAAVTNPAAMQHLHATMKDLGIQLAYDDFGAGQARLAELIEARPEVVKFDISLIRGIDSADDNRFKMLQSLVTMVQDLDIRALAEGIETPEEAQACREIGFELAQGYHFGRPSPA